MSGSVSKQKDKMLKHQNKRISQFQQSHLSYVGGCVCVYHILSPNILNPPPKKDKFIPQRHFLKWKENQNT